MVIFKPQKLPFLKNSYGRFIRGIHFPGQKSLLSILFNQLGSTKIFENYDQKINKKIP
jgi:hypothetical protein